jgi:hypothetical protein
MKSRFNCSRRPGRATGSSGQHYDEAHNVAERKSAAGGASLRANLARLLAAQADRPGERLACSDWALEQKRKPAMSSESKNGCDRSTPAVRQRSRKRPDGRNWRRAADAAGNAKRRVLPQTMRYPVQRLTRAMIRSLPFAFLATSRRDSFTKTL